jgi:hypothetical protein
MTVISTQDDMNLDPNMIKKTKVLACVSISKARMTQDAANIEKLIDVINNQFSFNDGRNKILSLSLVNCYSKIDTKQALEV